MALCFISQSYPKSSARNESEITVKQIQLKSYDDMVTKLEPQCNLEAEYKERGRLEFQVEREKKKDNEKSLILLKYMILAIPEPKEIFPLQKNGKPKTQQQSKFYVPSRQLES